MQKVIDAGDLSVTYEETGDAAGWPVLLFHGFPYDVRSYAEVAPLLAEKGARVIVPYVRGYGPTRFRKAETPRSGQQAALGADVLDLMDALHIEKAIVGGFDWGMRAAAVAGLFAPERVSGLVLVGGYAIQDIAKANEPRDAEFEYAYWYQWYFHTPRGVNGLRKNRREICRKLWRLWSPTWSRRDAAFEETAPSFDNPDFVDVVIHSYRHRYGNVPGDPRHEEWEKILAKRPPLSVPTISLFGADDTVMTPPADLKKQQDPHFTGFHDERILAGVGHNLPQESPREFASAVLDVRAH